MKNQSSVSGIRILSASVILLGAASLGACAMLEDFQMPGLSPSSQSVGPAQSATQKQSLENLQNIRVRVSTYSRAGRDVARKVRQDLNTSGYEAYIERLNPDSFALYVGRNMSPREAQRTKARLDARLGVSTLIVGVAPEEAQR